MSKKSFLFLCFIFLCSLGLSAQESHSLSIEISVSDDVQESFQQSGRLFVFLTTNSRGEPRRNTWPSPGNIIFAKNISLFKLFLTVLPP